MTHANRLWLIAATGVTLGMLQAVFVAPNYPHASHVLTVIVGACVLVWASVVSGRFARRRRDQASPAHDRDDGV